MERKIRQERERQARLHRAQAQEPGTTILPGGPFAPAPQADFMDVDEFEEEFWDEEEDAEDDNEDQDY